MVNLSSFFSPKILPAVTLSNSEDAVEVAEAILKGGLNVMEIAFRTEGAADALHAIRKALPEMRVGAGTILNKVQLKQAIDAGAQFGLSPGFNPAIVEEAGKSGLFFIPGVMTPSEIELAAEMGCSILKLFPAGQLGGTSFLKALQGPYEQLGVQFIPMGGVSLQNMKDYVRLKNVIAIGGSWLASLSLVETKNYAAIEKNVKEAIDSLTP